MASYNRWLVAEQNWKQAEEGRRAMEHIAAFRKQRDEKHLQQQRGRVEQDKQLRRDVSARGDETRQQKLEKGTAVRGETTQWREQLLTYRREWAGYGSSLKAVHNSDGARRVAAGMREGKEEAAKAVREAREVSEQEKEAALLREEEAKRVEAGRLRAATSRAVTDEARACFYAQRKDAAAAVSLSLERGAATIAAEREAYLERAVATREEVRDQREAAARAREEVVIAASADAAAEVRTQRLEIQRRQQEAKEAIQRQNRARRDLLRSSRLAPPALTARMAEHTQFRLLTSVVHDSRPSPVAPAKSQQPNGLRRSLSSQSLSS